MILQYKISAIFNIPMSWITEITHVCEPEFFVNEQRFGPYRFWHHQHHFRQVDEGVEMTDIVSYAMPLGPLGDLLRTFLIGKKLEDIFDYRRDRLKEIFHDGSMPMQPSPGIVPAKS